MEITAKMVKELREKSGAGIMDCKNVLKENNGDVEKSIKALREKGLASAEKKTSRAAAEGLVDSYIHFGGKIGVLLEVNCETDFVAKTDTFKQFCQDLCLHIAAAAPVCVSREEVPEDLIKSEREIYTAQMKKEGKPENIIDKIVDGKIEKYYSVICLLEQNYIKETSKTITELVKEMIASTGENIVVRRFVRYEVGEGIEVEKKSFAEEIQEELNK